MQQIGDTLTIEGDLIVLGTINGTASTSGTLGVNFSGTVYPTIAAGPNVTLTPGAGTAATTLTMSAAGGGTVIANPGINFSGTVYPTVAAGANVTLTPGAGTAATTLTMSAAGGTVIANPGVNFSGTVYPTIAAGANVTLTPGAGTAATTLTMSAAGGGGGSGGGLFSGVIANQSPNPPTVASMGFTVWENQRSSTFANGLNGVLFSDVVVEGTQLCNITKAAPSTPFTATIGLSFSSFFANNQFAFGFMDGSGKHEHINISNNGNSPFTLGLLVQRWNSDTSFNATMASLPFAQNPVWLQVKNNGTTVQYNYSFDGEVFINLFTTNISGGFLSSYTTLALTLNSQSGQATSSIFYYKQTSP
jgi:hypothetical protein